MFKVKVCKTKVACKIIDGQGNYLHSDGSIQPCGEYWPTLKLAQAVLDKYYPQHVWMNGDVFDDGDGTFPKIYIKVLNQEPQIFHLSGCYPYSDDGLPAFSPVAAYINLEGATFLFNVKEKL